MTTETGSSSLWRRESGSIKICGLTAADDTKVAVDAGADAIGLNFHPGSKRFLTTEEAALVAAPARDSCTIVGIFVNADPQRVLEVAEALCLDAIQLHGEESPEITAWIRQRSESVVIKAFVAGSADLDNAEEWGCDPIVVDAPVGGSGQTYDWGLLTNLPRLPRVLMAGGLCPANVASAITAVQPWGVDVASGVESAPGRKDPELIREFIAHARSAFSRTIPNDG